MPIVFDFIQKLGDFLNGRATRSRSSRPKGDGVSVRDLNKAALYSVHEMRQYQSKFAQFDKQLNPLPDLMDRYQEVVNPFLALDQGNTAFTRTVPGVHPDIVHAFTHQDLLTQHAKRHQLIYYRGTLVAIDAKVNRLPLDTDRNRLVINTLAGPIKPYNHGREGYFDAVTGTALHCFEDVNLHLRFLIQPHKFRVMLENLSQQLREENQKDIEI